MCGGGRTAGFLPGREYLVPELLREVGGPVQREAWHQGGSEHVAAAQLVNHFGHAEERVVQQQLPERDTQVRGRKLDRNFSTLRSFASQS